MILLIESICVCLVFSVLILPQMFCGDPLKQVFNYPPKIVERCLQLGLISERQTIKSWRVILLKAIVSLIIAFAFAAIVYFINGAQHFIPAFLITYALWNVGNWYDAIVIDCLIFCHSKRVIIPGTEDMQSEYHNYAFHLKQGLLGMLIGLLVAAAVGGLAELFNFLAW